MAPETDKAATRLILEELKKPWSAKLTAAQAQQRQDIITAKRVWEEVLQNFREQKKTLFVKDRTKKRDKNKDDKEDDTEEPYCSFFDLPGSIRNMIYDICIEDDHKERKHRKRIPSKRPIKLGAGWGSAEIRRFLATQIPISERVKEEPTLEQKERENSRLQLLNIIIIKRLKQADADSELTTGAREAFEKYRLEHEMYARRCWHEKHTVKSIKEKNEVAVVNARGNLCEDMPMLSLVNRTFFQETFYLFYSIPREGVWFSWTVRNLDFFPLFRFWQSLTKPPFPVEVNPVMIHVQFDKEDELRDKELHTRKFSNVRRLIELHWLEGFPLWGCLTGLAEDQDELTEDQDGPTKHQDCKGPFGDWMYSVRQIVALYRIDPKKWRDITFGYLQRCELTEKNRTSKTYWYELEDAEFVEVTIEMLCKAIKYHLGYEGNFSLIGRDGNEWAQDVFNIFRFKKQYRKIAYEVEHSIVHIVRQYCEKIDGVLRKQLGEAYGEWEELPDEEAIPQGVVL